MKKILMTLTALVILIATALSLIACAQKPKIGPEEEAVATSAVTEEGIDKLLTATEWHWLLFDGSGGCNITFEAGAVKGRILKIEDGKFLLGSKYTVSDEYTIDVDRQTVSFDFGSNFTEFTYEYEDGEIMLLSNSDSYIYFYPLAARTTQAISAILEEFHWEWILRDSYRGVSYNVYSQIYFRNGKMYRRSYYDVNGTYYDRDKDYASVGSYTIDLAKSLITVQNGTERLYYTYYYDGDTITGVFLIGDSETSKYEKKGPISEVLG